MDAPLCPHRYGLQLLGGYVTSIIAFLKKHPTKITGFLLAAVGALQAQASTIQSFMAQNHFAMFTVGAGIFVSILGFINSNRDQ